MSEHKQRQARGQSVDRLVDLMYAGIDDDDQLRLLFGRDLTGPKSRQKMFFAEWLGGRTPLDWLEQAAPFASRARGPPPCSHRTVSVNLAILNM